MKSGMTPTQKRPERQRNVQMHFMVTPQERALMEQRMSEAGMTNMGSFLRAIALKGYIIRLDLSEVNGVSSLLRSVAGNVNQIAKRANQEGGIYASDMQELTEKYEALYAEFTEIKRNLSNL